MVVVLLLVLVLVLLEEWINLSPTGL